MSLNLHLGGFNSKCALLHMKPSKNKMAPDWLNNIIKNPSPFHFSLKLFSSRQYFSPRGYKVTATAVPVITCGYHCVLPERGGIFLLYIFLYSLYYGDKPGFPKDFLLVSCLAWLITTITSTNIPTTAVTIRYQICLFVCLFI